MFDQAALLRRQELQGAAGPMAIVRNGKVFGIACFACIGGLVYDMNFTVVCDARLIHQKSPLRLQPGSLRRCVGHDSFQEPHGRIHQRLFEDGLACLDS
jgi:hypothetical protein